MQKVIEVQNLTKVYKNGIKAVQNISFEVYEGEMFAFLGPNGAGKTTTISILTTTLSKTSGDVKVCGYDIEKESKNVRQNIGIIFQKPSVDKDLTGEENIRFHSVLFGIIGFAPSFNLCPKNYKNKLLELAELFDLKDYIFKPIKEYSGGMLRKLEIIRSLMHKPKILFLDEPTVGLAPEARKTLWDYLLNIQKIEGLTIFLTTHYLDEVENADRVCIINKGNIIALNTPRNLKREYEQKTVTFTLNESYIKIFIEIVKNLNLKYQILSANMVKIEFTDIQQIRSILNFEGVIDIDIVKPKLEDVYIQIIQKE